MAKEIERKFLVNPSKISFKGNGDELKQGYLSITDSGLTRIRVTSKQGFLTIKSKTIGISREEYEYEIPIDDANRLIQLSAGEVIHKTRTKVTYDGKIWEIDEFHGKNKGLWLAEIELVNSNEWKKDDIEQDSWKYWLKTYCSNNQIDFIDPTQHFFEIDSKGVEIYEDHFSEAGHVAFSKAFIEWHKKTKLEN